VAVEQSRPEKAVDIVATVFRTTIVGTERSYAPLSADVITDDPWERQAWDNEKETLYFVYPGAGILGERRTTGTQDENVLLTVLAAHRDAASRTTDILPVPALELERWRVKTRLAADVKRQIEAGFAAGLIPGDVIEDILYNVNLAVFQEGWDVAHVELEVRYRRTRANP
jgi:hypothetical protein